MRRKVSSTPIPSTGFVSWIRRNVLLDLGYIGSDYTWCKSSPNDMPVGERLYRELSTTSWRLCFAEAFVRHLPRLYSNHYPLLLQLHSEMTPRAQLRPFQFEAMWLLNENLFTTVEDFWHSKSLPLVQKLDALQRNTEVFDNLFQRKRHIMNRLAGIHRSLTTHHNPYLRQLETELFCEYNSIMDQEEIFWKQKSRNTWSRDGHHNRRFFHLSTITRRRRNKIEGLYNSQGQWMNTKEGLHSLVTEYLTDLFEAPGHYTRAIRPPSLLPPLSAEVLLQLQSPVLNAVIQKTLFQFGAFEAPGPDGLPAQFYKTFWPLCQQEVCAMIHHCF